MKKRRRYVRTNPVARALRAPGGAFRKRAERLRTKYRRHPKHPGAVAPKD